MLPTAGFLTDCLRRFCPATSRHPTFWERIGMPQTAAHRRVIKATKLGDIALAYDLFRLCDFP